MAIVAVVAVAFTAGTTIPAVAGALAAVAKASFVTGMVMGLMGVADKAGSDIANKEVSDVDEYAGKAAKDTFAGAVCGALFAPFMIPAAGTGLLGEIPTALQRTGTLLKTMYIGGTFNYTYYDLRERTDGRIPSIQQGVKVFRDGALFSGFIYTAGTAILEVAPFIKNTYKNNIKSGTKGAAEAASIHPGQLAAESSEINQASIMRALRQSGSDEGQAAAKLLKRGNLELDIAETHPKGWAGQYVFGENKISIYTDNISTPERAAGYVTHEAKHYIQDLTPQTYTRTHEFEAYTWQRSVDKTWPIRTDSDIWNFINTNDAYRNVRK